MGTICSILPRRARGYTLIEMVVVMAVLGVLATAVFPLAEISLQREREKQLQRALWEIRDAIDAYKRANDQGLIGGPRGATGYPPSLLALSGGVAASGVDTGGRLVFLRRVPRDPFAPAELPPEQTWGLRSYLSPSDAPQPGDDVYDVYSRSERTGLNGVPLKAW
jgi:general secretion pathway protein G